MLGLTMFDSNKELLYQQLASLGAIYPLDIFFDYKEFQSQLLNVNTEWKVYNKNKPICRRFGLSLFSLDGSASGEIDLNSIREYNAKNGTNYDELSFNKPTPLWKHFSSISEKLTTLEPHLGRSHLIKLEEGGFFPPHRDLGQAFRLISFFNCSSSAVTFVLDDKKIFFRSNSLYYINARLIHSLVSFQSNAIILVLNVELSSNSNKFVLKNLLEK